MSDQIPEIVISKLFSDIAFMVSERLSNFRDNKWLFSDAGYANSVTVVSVLKPYPEISLTIYLVKTEGNNNVR